MIFLGNRLKIKTRPVSFMSLQFKVIGLILVVFLGYGALDYAVQRLFILPSFQTLEREEALKNMDRTAQAIDREIAVLVQLTSDWASWDDAYRV
jgi:sensor domain CHASE-containing protein